MADKQPKKPNLIDDFIEGVRQIFDDLERVINPEKQPKRTPVPVPVRERHDPRDPRNPSHR